jgi:hypothetical protein
MENQKIIEDYEKEILRRLKEKKPKWVCIDKTDEDAACQISSALTKCHLTRLLSTASFIFFCLEDK